MSMVELDIYEIRRQNFLKIRDEKCDGNATELARQLNRAQPYIFRLLAPLEKEHSRKISEKTANHITDTFGLPRGWMDTPSDTTTSLRPHTTTKVTRCIEDMDDTQCRLKELDKPFDALIPPSILNAEVIQVLSDKYYPRIHYGEFVVVKHSREAIAGSDTLICYSDDNSSELSLCDFIQVESIRNGVIRTNTLIGNNPPKSYQSSDSSVSYSQLIAVLDPAFLDITE